jgi:hypothetical protein
MVMKMILSPRESGKSRDITFLNYVFYLEREMEMVVGVIVVWWCCFIASGSYLYFGVFVIQIVV